MPRAYKKKLVRKVVSKRQPKKNMVKALSVSRAVKSYVARAIGAHSENKTPAGYATLDATLNGMSSTTWGTVIPLSNVWTLAQGTGQGDRIGNVIKPKMWNIKGYVHNNSSAGVPCVVKMFIIRAQNTYASPSTTITNPTDFFEFGNSTIAPNLSFLDVMRKVNKEKYIHYTSRIFKVGPALSGASSTNNDFKCVCPFNINLLKYAKKDLRYNDGGSSIPNNSGLFAVFVIGNYDGSAGVILNGPQISYDIEARFEDA